MATVAAKLETTNGGVTRSPTPRLAAPADDGRLLKLVAVNVAGLRAVLRTERAKLLVALVEREGPDVLCLSEHKLKEEDTAAAEQRLRELLPEEYATVFWSCSTQRKGYSGVAMVLRRGEPVMPSDLPVATDGMGIAYGDDPIIAQEGRLLTLELPELSIVTAYVPNSGTGLKRLSCRVDDSAGWDRAFGKYICELRERRSKPVVVLGDLNCCHGVRDIWNMHGRPDFPDGLSKKPLEEQYVGLSNVKRQAGLTPEERSSFSQLLAEADLVDTFRLLHPDARGVFSYFSQRIVRNRPLNRGLRLDYVLASSCLCTHLLPGAREEEGLPRTPRLHDSFVLDDELIADHAAVGCHILLPPL